MTRKPLVRVDRLSLADIVDDVLDRGAARAGMPFGVIRHVTLELPGEPPVYIPADDMRVNFPFGPLPAMPRPFRFEIELKRT